MKGISPIISAVILVGITLSVASVYSGWAPDFAESFVESSLEGTESDLRCDNANFRIDSADYFPGTDTVEVYLTNTGTISFHNDINLYALDSSQTSGNRELSNLQAGDSRSISFEVSDSPEEVVVTSSDCPELETSVSLE